MSWRLFCPDCGWTGEEGAASKPICQDCGHPLHIWKDSIIVHAQPFPDMNGPTVDLSGAKLTPEQFDRAREMVLGGKVDHERQ